MRPAVGSVHNEWPFAPGRPTRDRQRGEVADVVRVVVGEEDTDELGEVEPGGNRSQRCASPTVDQHPRVVIGDCHG